MAYISGSELCGFALARWTSALLFSHEFYQRHRSFVVDLPCEFLDSAFLIHCRPLLISVSAGCGGVNHSLLLLGNDLLQGDRCGGLVIFSLQLRHSYVDVNRNVCLCSMFVCMIRIKKLYPYYRDQ